MALRSIDDPLYVIEAIRTLYLDDSSDYVVEIEARTLLETSPYGRHPEPHQKSFHFLFPNIDEAQSEFEALLHKIQQQRTEGP